VSSTKAHSEIGIREASDADLVSMLAILNHEIETSAYVWGESPKTLEDRIAWLAAHRAADLPVVVAMQNGHVAGWASLSTFRPASGYRFTAEVSVYVAPEARGLGVARAMVERLEQAARGREIRSLIAVVDCDNEPSVRLFRGLGFEEAGRLNDIGRKFGQWRSEVFLIKVVPPR
jgi:L-amino acid N-acyltransferase